MQRNVSSTTPRFDARWPHKRDRYADHLAKLLGNRGSSALFSLFNSLGEWILSKIMGGYSSSGSRRRRWLPEARPSPPKMATAAIASSASLFASLCDASSPNSPG